MINLTLTLEKNYKIHHVFSEEENLDLEELDLSATIAQTSSIE